MSLKQQIKEVIVRALMLEEVRAEDIQDDMPLFSEEGLGLDSVDALELAIELERAFGVTIPDNEQTRAVFTSVQTLADFIERVKA